MMEIWLVVLVDEVVVVGDFFEFLFEEVWLIFCIEGDVIVSIDLLLFWCVLINLLYNVV